MSKEPQVSIALRPESTRGLSKASCQCLERIEHRRLSRNMGGTLALVALESARY